MNWILVPNEREDSAGFDRRCEIRGSVDTYVRASERERERGLIEDSYNVQVVDA